MSKTEVITWHIASHRLVRKSDGLFGRVRYEVSTQYMSELKSSINIDNKWVHKQFSSLDKAVEYYISTVEEAKL